MQIFRMSLLATLLFSTCTPALAQQSYLKDMPMIKRSHLPQTEFWHAPVRVGIENTGPIVSDWRHPTQSTPLVVPVPPMPQSGGGNFVLPPGATAVGNNVYVVPAMMNSSNPMMGDRYLQDAGPRSYVPSSPITAGRNLPMGTSTGIHGSMKAPPAVPFARAQNSAPTTRPPARPNFEQSPPVALYSPTMSVGTSSSTKVRTDTSIRLLQKQK